MALYLIGIGLSDEKDITVKGLEAVRKCGIVYLESYTSKLSCSVEVLENFYGKKIIIAGRELVEQKAENEILKPALEKDVALLVIGDPLSATTHTDLILRANKANVKVHIIHNASVLTAVGITGLELYKFGKVTSIPFENENIKAPVEAYRKNNSIGLHTLFLLDLRPQENKYMAVHDALAYLLRNGVGRDVMCVGCAGLGSDDAQIKYGPVRQLINYAGFTKTPQCLIIPDNLHFIEEEALECFKL